MDLLDRLLGHDLWTTRHLLRRCRELEAGELGRRFDIGHETLYDTFLHIVESLEVWSDLLYEQPVQPARPRPTMDPDPFVDQLEPRLERAAADFGAIARRLTDEGRLDELWLDVLDHPPALKSYGGAIAHVLTHNMQHRSEILHMLQRLGMEDLIEGDVLSWERRHQLHRPRLGDDEAF